MFVRYSYRFVICYCCSEILTFSEALAVILVYGNLLSDSSLLQLFRVAYIYGVLFSLIGPICSASFSNLLKVSFIFNPVIPIRSTSLANANSKFGPSTCNIEFADSSFPFYGYVFQSYVEELL